MNFSRQQVLTVAVVILAALCVYLFATRSSGPAAVEVRSGTPAGIEEGVGSTNAAVEPTGNAGKPGTQANPTTPPSTPALAGKLAPELVRPGGFSNSDAFLLRDFIGKKVVLVQFWTTSSDESERTIPYLTDWNAKYRNYGLVIIGIHTPRFVFERSKNVVDDYAKTHNMSYPLVIDNGAETWKAYRNNYWPHTYLIDMSGKIVYDHVGEGAYQTFEERIQTLLKDRAAKLRTAALPENKLTVKTGPVLDPTQHTSAEGFFGSRKNTNLANGASGKDGVQTFDSLSEPKMDMSYLFGIWKISGEYAESMTEHNYLIYRYHGKTVDLLAGAKSMRVKVLLDGKPLSAANAGSDISYEKNDSVVYIGNPRLYKIVNATAGYGDHSIEFIPDAGGFDIYSLIFN